MITIAQLTVRFQVYMLIRGKEGFDIPRGKKKLGGLLYLFFKGLKWKSICEIKNFKVDY